MFDDGTGWRAKAYSSRPRFISGRRWPSSWELICRADPGRPESGRGGRLLPDDFTRVFAAGDLSAQMPQVAAAIASGSHAAAAVVQSLMADEYGLAVPEGRQNVNA